MASLRPSNSSRSQKIKYRDAWALACSPPYRCHIALFLTILPLLSTVRLRQLDNINYIVVNIRSNIARASSKFSKFLRNPFLDYINTVNCLFRYFVDIRFLVIEYNGLDLHSLRTFIISFNVFFVDTSERKNS